MADPITSKRVIAVLDLETRLGKIQKSKGYSSDAGLNIFLGEVPILGKDDPDTALAILLLNDEALEGSFTQGGLVRYKVPIEVYATAKIPSRARPLLVFEGLIADIKQAAEIEGRDTGTNAARDRYLGIIPDSDPAKPVTLPKGFERGSTRVHFREGGSEIIGVTVEYFMSIEEQWGQP
jgi:hypothetical protein